MILTPLTYTHNHVLPKQEGYYEAKILGSLLISVSRFTLLMMASGQWFSKNICITGIEDTIVVKSNSMIITSVQSVDFAWSKRTFVICNFVA